MSQKYLEISDIISCNNAEAFQKVLDQGFVIENGWQDRDAFLCALDAQDGNTDISKNLDQYEFKIAELFLTNGFDLIMHRNLLTEQLELEYNYWFDMNGYSAYGEYPDGRGSAYLLKKKAHLHWLTQAESNALDQGRTALDIAYKWNKDYNFSHPYLIPYLKKAGCKHAADLTHQERVLACYLGRIVELGNIDDVEYFLSALPVLSSDELEGGVIPLLHQMSKNLALPLYSDHGSVEWEKYLNRVIRRILNQKWDHQYWLLNYMEDFASTQVHPTHVKNKTALKQIMGLVGLGAPVNQISTNEKTGNLSVFDYALQAGHTEIIQYLKSQGAQTSQYLFENGYITRDDHDLFWKLKSEWE